MPEAGRPDEPGSGTSDEGARGGGAYPPRRPPAGLRRGGAGTPGGLRRTPSSRIGRSGPGGQGERSREGGGYRGADRSRAPRRADEDRPRRFGPDSADQGRRDQGGFDRSSSPGRSADGGYGRPREDRSGHAGERRGGDGGFAGRDAARPGRFDRGSSGGRDRFGPRQGGGFDRRPNGESGGNRSDRGGRYGERDDRYSKPGFDRRPAWDRDRSPRPGAGDRGNRFGKPDGGDRADRSPRGDRPYRRDGEGRPTGGGRPYGGGQGRSTGGYRGGQGGEARPYRRTADGQGGEGRPFRGDRDSRPQGGGRPYGGGQGRGGRPFGGGQGRESRPYRGDGERPYRRDQSSGDRPYRSGAGGGRPGQGSDRPYRRDQGGGDRPYRNDRSTGDRPYRSGTGGGRPGNSSDRPDRNSSDRPYRNDRNSSDRPYRNDRSTGDRPYRSGTGGGRPGQGSDRPYRNDRNSSDRPYRNDRSTGDRPYRSGTGGGRPGQSSDRPYRNDRSTGDRPYRSGPAGAGRGDDRGTPRPYRDRSEYDRTDNRTRPGDLAAGPLSGGPPRSSGDEPRPESRPQPPINRQWGGVARRGAGEVLHPGDRESASEVWRQTVARSEEAKGRDGQRWAPDEVWVLEPDADTDTETEPTTRSVRPPATTDRDLATGREGTPSPGGHRRKLPRPVVDELSRTAGTERGAKLANRIADATYAYERERYQDARRILRTLAEEVPDSATVRELYGLVLYRTGQWSAAVKQLEAFRELSGSYDQHPVLADCYRALHRWDDAEAIWEDLREASPSGDLVAEGRIVAAGVKADRGDLAGAILMLEKASRKVAKPQERHLRQWYALADLYERAGDVPKARDLFNRVAGADPDAFDVRSRLRALR